MDTSALHRYSDCDPIGPKTALIISGALRNYDAALLSLPIWGECDRYLVTWESAGNEQINDYRQKAGITQSYVVSDSELDKFDPGWVCNPLRMLYLWQKAHDLVPRGYDWYILIRPDCFYWATQDLSTVVKQVDGIAARSTIPVYYNSLQDQVMVASNSHWRVFHRMVDDYYKRLPLYSIHTFLAEYFCSRGIDVTSVELCGAIKDMVIVRDTFNSLPTDRYDKILYQALFYDTAAWWRRVCRSDYAGVLQSD